MSKCCNNNNYLCGTDVIGTLEVLNKIQNKAGREGYYWTPGKRLIINFGNRDIAPQPNFKVSTIQEIAADRMKPINEWKSSKCDIPNGFKFPIGSWDSQFEQTAMAFGLAKKVQTYIDLVIEHANLNLTYINGVGFNQVLNPYNISQDIEGVIDVYFNNFDGNKFGNTSNIGKYFNPTALNPSNQVFNLNDFNSTIHYFEEKDSDEPGEPPQILDIILNLKIQNTLKYEEFETAINNKISSLFQASGKQFYNTLKIKFIKDETYRYNIRYKCKFTITGGGEGSPEKVYITIPDIEGGWKTFGINQGETLIFGNNETNLRYFDTIYKSDLNFYNLQGKVIMHEFMHILGFMHDQNIGSAINPYKDDRVWNKRPNSFITFEDITSPVGYGFDFESVMIYPIYCCNSLIKQAYFDDTRLINTRQNMNLSLLNKQNISLIYPGQKKNIKLSYPLKTVENYHHKKKSNNILFLMLNIFFVIFLIILLFI
jgi:hypothetical protein